jgi:hypothetical protein
MLKSLWACISSYKKSNDSTEQADTKNNNRTRETNNKWDWEQNNVWYDPHHPVRFHELYYFFPLLIYGYMLL